MDKLTMESGQMVRCLGKIGLSREWKLMLSVL